VAPRKTLGWLGACAALAALGGCASTPPEQDPVQIKLNDLDVRLARVEHVVTNQSLLQIANEIEALRSDVRSLHNDVDLLRNDQEAARKQQRSLYADVDQRLRALESHREGAGTGAPPATAAAEPAALPAPVAAGAGGLPVPDGSDRANYQAAFALLKDSQYDKAVAAFEQFLTSFPDSPFAENAQYWLGEAYYVNKDFTTSLAAFQRVVDKYPQSRKVPDALLKIGYCRYELKQPDQAKAVLTDVAARFADTPAGHLAQQRLQKMESEKP
jgi:tol-pal system protein YbgF